MRSWPVAAAKHIAGRTLAMIGLQSRGKGMAIAVDDQFARLDAL